MINQPLVSISRLQQYDIICTVAAAAARGPVPCGGARALIADEPALRPALKHGGFLTRDAREVERKKYGKAKARRSFQFSKR